MTKPREMPLSGYAIENVYTYHQLLEHKDPGEEDTHGAVDIGWDWWLVGADEPTFEVRLSATVESSPQRDDHISAGLIGRFRMIEKPPSVPVVQFVRLQATAILLPYLRQVLSNLTSTSFHGTYYLPPINAVELMKDFDAANTIGARQLRELTEGTSSVDNDIVSVPDQGATGTKSPAKTRKPRGGKRPKSKE